MSKRSRVRYDPIAAEGLDGLPFAVALIKAGAVSANVSNLAQFTPQNFAPARNGNVAMLAALSASVSAQTSGTLTVNLLQNGVVIGTVVFASTGAQVQGIDLRNATQDAIQIKAGDVLSISTASGGSPVGVTDLHVHLIMEAFGLK